MTNQTQVLIDVALLERATTRIKEYEAISTRTTLAAELAALIPTDPMAEAREVWWDAHAAFCARGDPAAVEVIHIALNADGRKGYVDAYYEIAAMLDIPAQTLSPREVFETQIKPRLAALNAPRPMTPEVSEAGLTFKLATLAKWLDHSNPEGDAQNFIDTCNEALTMLDRTQARVAKLQAELVAADASMRLSMHALQTYGDTEDGVNTAYTGLRIASDRSLAALTAQFQPARKHGDA